MGYTIFVSLQSQKHFSVSSILAFVISEDSMVAWNSFAQDTNNSLWSCMIHTCQKGSSFLMPSMSSTASCNAHWGKHHENKFE